MSDQAAEVQAKEAQRQASRRATFAALKEKKPAESEFMMALGGDGEKMSFLFRAIGTREYDKLITRYPPTPDQRADGFSYDQDKFGPDLLSKVCVEPSLNKDEWTEIWNADEWNRGEIGQLFMTAANLCNQGLELTPINAG